MKIKYKILRTHAGKVGYVSVIGGIYSERNITKWDSKIEIDGQWYDIPDHFDTHEYKHLIQGVEVTGIVSESYGKKSYHEIKSGLINRDDCVKNLWCESYNALNKTKIGDVFEYGIDLDLAKVNPRSLSKTIKNIGWMPKVDEKYNIEEIIEFKVLWHQGINFKKQ